MAGRSCLRPASPTARAAVARKRVAFAGVVEHSFGRDVGWSVPQDDGPALGLCAAAMPATAVARWPDAAQLDADRDGERMWARDYFRHARLAGAERRQLLLDAGVPAAELAANAALMRATRRLREAAAASIAAALVARGSEPDHAAAVEREHSALRPFAAALRARAARARRAAARRAAMRSDAIATREALGRESANPMHHRAPVAAAAGQCEDADSLAAVAAAADGAASAADAAAGRAQSLLREASAGLGGGGPAGQQCAAASPPSALQQLGSMTRARRASVLQGAPRGRGRAPPGRAAHHGAQSGDGVC